MSVLVVVAHGDDEILGCGGTMAKFAAAGRVVGTIIMCGEGDNVRMRTVTQIAAADRAALAVGSQKPIVLSGIDQRLDRASFLDLTQELERAVSFLKPQVIFTHHAGDLNLDHRITHQAVLTACRPLPGSTITAIYGMEVLSSTEWGETFHPTHFVSLSREDILKKNDALHCYKAEMRTGFHPRSAENSHRLAELRGRTIGVEFAEAFTTIRTILK